MYRRPVPGAAPVPTPATAAPGGLNPQMASSLLQAVASQAQSSGGASAYPTPSPSSPPTPAPVQTISSHLHVSTNSASFHSLLNTHRVVVANFTAPRTCGPCRMVEPVFEELSRSKAREGVAFTKIDLDVGMGQGLAAEYGVRATPTFIFFLDGKKVRDRCGGYFVCDTDSQFYTHTDR
jgi:desumoylating isopeptidase 1